MGGDHHAVVRDVQQAVPGLHAHLLPGEVAAHVVAVLEDADAPGLIDPASDDPRPFLGYLLDLDLPVHDLDEPVLGKLEAADQGDVADGLVLPVVVVVGDPPVEVVLGLSIEPKVAPVKNSFRIVLCSRSILPVVVGE